ncbi:MAG: hypothetical protein PUB89_14240 [Oscillospiraceae bacterium]|nr:hypothetical protein [Oscillospiraceae bacterium]
MATSSIRKNFVVYGDEQAKIFANAIEESANHAAPEIKVNVKKISGSKELRALMINRDTVCDTKFSS